MAANINNSPPRFDYARAERDDESSQGDAATPDEKTPPQSETTVAAPTEQQGQSSGDGGGSEAGSHDPASTPPPPVDAETVKPSFMRYGLGDTVIMGRPEYARAYVAEVAGRERDGNGDIGEPRVFAHAQQRTVPPMAAPVAATNNKANNATSPLSSPSASPSPLQSLRQPNDPTPKPVLAEVNEPPTNRQPYLASGLHTLPEQSPHYANALAYGKEHSYNDDEIMKLAVLMQANRDQNMGREWLTLKPAVLRAAVNAVVHNPIDGSFDTSAVFGGRLGYPESQLPVQRVNIDENGEGYTLDVDYNRTPAALPTTPPPGWVLEIIPANHYGDNPSPEQRYFRMSDELFAAKENPYLPLAVASYMQVPRGYESELSVGADGGVHDLSALDFDPEFGLVTRTDNYRPYSADGNDWDRFMEIVTVLTISAGAMAAIGPVVVAGMGASTAGVVAAGAINGVIGSAITTMLQEGEVTFRGLLQAAFSGGMLAGLNTLESYQGLRSMGLDRAGNVTSYALRAMSITGTSTIRGAIQALTGGSFRDGFTQGIVQGLSLELTRYLNAEINAGVAHEQITPAQASALRELSNFTGTALRAAANPNDPMYAFAQDYLGQLFGPPEARDLNGGNKPVDAETQQQMIWMQDAIDLGYADTAATHFNNILERRAAANPTTPRTDIANQLIRELGIKPDTLGFVVGANGRVTVDPATVTGRPLTPPPTLEARNTQRQNDYMQALQAMNTNLSDADARALAQRWMDSPYSPLDPDLPDNVRQAMARGLDPSMIIDLDTGSNLHPRALRPAAAQLYRDLLGAAETQYVNDPVRLEQAYRDIDRVVNEYNGIIRSAEYVLSGGAARDQRLNAILNDVVVRGGGLLQMIGGAGLVMAGSGAATTGLGAVLGALGIALGTDQMYAGARTAINGAPARTMLGTAIERSMGLDPRQAEMLAGLASMSPALLEVALANQALRTALSQRVGPILGTDKPEIVTRLGTPATNMGRLSGPIDQLTAEELAFANEMVAGGRTVEILPTSNAGRTADFLIDGTKYELKTVSGIQDITADNLSGRISSRIMDARGQSADIIIDARGQAGMTADIAQRAVNRAFRQDTLTGGKIQTITIITPEGTFYIPRKP